jgi:hypothetical protein
MSLITNSVRDVFDVSQITLLYQGGTTVPDILIGKASLVESTDGLPYKTGTLLAKYGTNAPAGLAGMYVNYDPDSANLDQQVCVGAISQTMMTPIYGATAATVGSDTVITDLALNTVDFLSFLIGNNASAMFYENAIVYGSTPAAVTGFRAAFVLNTVAEVMANDTMTKVLTIQGVN